MIGPLPWTLLITIDFHLPPTLILPIEHSHPTTSFLVLPSSPEQHHAISFLHVVQTAVGSDRWHLPGGLDLLPFHAVGIVGPEIVFVG